MAPISERRERAPHRSAQVGLLQGVVCKKAHWARGRRTVRLLRRARARLREQASCQALALAPGTR
eukprot:4861986-Pyramimonas_sp.AAC.1